MRRSAGAGQNAGGTGPPPFELRWVLLVVGVKCALHFAVAGRYGWQRDELYYAVAGLHL